MIVLIYFKAIFSKPICVTETDKIRLILSVLLILPLLTSKAIALSRFSKP